MARTKILNVPFDTYTLDEAAKKVVELMDSPRQHMVCTPNPEIVMEAQKNLVLMNILKSADIVTPDGIGVVWASKYSETKLKERVSGYDLILKVFDKIKYTDHTVYFFGGEPGVAEKAVKNVRKKYQGIKIIGFADGYFDEAKERAIIKEINSLKPTLLLVGLGSPKQEQWIYDNLRLTGAKVSIGIGGCFDVMSGKIKRAPDIFRKLGLEWFYRLITQPTRIKRMLKLPLFVLTVRKKMR